MTNTHRAALVAVAALCGLGGCQSQHADTAWTAEGTLLHKRSMPNGEPRWEHQFVYHPQQQVYYEPYTQVYYWFENDTWMEGSILPRTIRLTPDHVKFVSVMLPKPWMNHDSVAARHRSQTGTLVGSLDPANLQMEPQPLFASEPATQAELAADPAAETDAVADADTAEAVDVEPIELTGVDTDSDIDN